MFMECSQLTSLDLSNFNTTKAESYGHMFYGCSQLSLLNISNFDTLNAAHMNHMFYGCAQLTSLNLSNFDTSKVTDMDYMFDGCLLLKYINLKNFGEDKLAVVTNIFNNVPDNIVACLNENSVQIKQEISKKINYRLDCSDDWEIKQIHKEDVCFDYFNQSILYEYEYQGKYYEDYTNKNLTNNTPIKYCNCTLADESCLYCSNNPLKNNNLCIKCNYDYYEIENDNNNNINEYKKCYKEPVGYYLDLNSSIYKKCFFSCETCEIQGNNKTHNCKECSNDYPLEFKINNSNYSNCFQNCSYYYYFDEIENFHCTENNTCPRIFPILDGRECIKDIKIINMEENLKDCLNNEKEIFCYDSILKEINDIFSSKLFDTYDLDNDLIKL